MSKRILRWMDYSGAVGTSWAYRSDGFVVHKAYKGTKRAACNRSIKITGWNAAYLRTADCKKCFRASGGEGGK